MNMQKLTRRDALKAFSAGALASGLSACATMGQKSVGRVVVVGAGTGVPQPPSICVYGPTVPSTSLWSIPTSLYLVPDVEFGARRQQDIGGVTVGYSGLDKYGVKRMRDTVSAVDVDRKQVRLASGATLPYDRWSYHQASNSCTTDCRDGLLQEKRRYCTRGRQGRRRSRCAVS